MQQGIRSFPQERLVQRIGIVFVQLRRHPGAAHGPQRPFRAAWLPRRAAVGDPHRIGVGPDIGVVVMDEAAAAVVRRRRLLPLLAQPFQQPHIRGQAIRQAAALGRPIVHLRVDIGGPVAAPRGPQLPAPDPLQIGGQAAGPGGGDEQIPAVLEIQRVQPRILSALPQDGQPPIGGHSFLRPKPQFHPVEQGAVIPAGKAAVNQQHDAAVPL